MKKIRNFFKNTFNKITLFYENKIRPRKDKVISFILKYLGISFVHKQFLKLNAKRRKAVIGLLFVLPWLVGLYIFGLQPFIQAIRISLADQAKYVIDLNTNSVAFEAKAGHLNILLVFLNTTTM